MKNINLIFIFFVLCFKMQAQELITVIEIPNLSDEQLASIENYRSQEFVKDLKFIKVNDLSTVIKDGIIAINLPDKESEYSMKIIGNTQEGEDSYTYAAENQENESNFTLSSYEGHISATIQLANEFYKIFPISEEYQLLVSYNGNDGNCGKELLKTDQIQGEAPPLCIMNENKCTINLIIFYTQSSLASVPTGYNTTPKSMQSLGLELATRVNTAFGNSKVLHRITIVGTELLPDAQATGGAYAELDYYSKLLAVKTTKTSLSRLQKKADIVVFLTKGDSYKGYSGLTGGLAFDLGNSHSVVKMSAALSTNTFVHEVGHLFGADHDLYGSLPGTPPACGYKIMNDVGTIMATSGLKTLVLHFSNPNVKYKNKVTGTQNEYNACVIQRNGCGVSKIIN